MRVRQGPPRSAKIRHRRIHDDKSFNYVRYHVAKGRDSHELDWTASPLGRSNRLTRFEKPPSADAGGGFRFLALLADEAIGGCPRLAF